MQAAAQSTAKEADNISILWMFDVKNVYIVSDPEGGIIIRVLVTLLFPQEICARLLCPKQLENSPKSCVGRGTIRHRFIYTKTKTQYSVVILYQYTKSIL